MGLGFWHCVGMTRKYIEKIPTETMRIRAGKRNCFNAEMKAMGCVKILQGSLASFKS
jgi:hypothetical protein